MKGSKDLFDDSTMSFGEHLECLRIHLWKALIGLIACVIAALFFGGPIVGMIRAPIDLALKKHGLVEQVEVKDDVGEFNFLDYLKSQFGVQTDEEAALEEKLKAEEAAEKKPLSPTLTVQVEPSQLYRALHQYDPNRFPLTETKEDTEDEADTEELVPLEITAPEFAVFKKTSEDINKPVTLNVQEAFMTYLKVSFVAGLVMASPWVFYQIWLFVAAGLYRHERRYIYVFLPISLTLFVAGLLFCFFFVFPFILKFLLSFNTMLGVQPQIRLSEWISFAIVLPMMFGVSFQLPLVMLFLERISVFSSSDYRDKRRLAILVIATLSMLLTPADPASMLLMMFPMLGLYELGILLCHFTATKNPFQAEAA